MGLDFRLTRCQRFSYSVGHVFNDLCSAMWFTYLLIFMRDVVKLSNASAGYLLLWGQVVDALCTPVIGYCSDKMRDHFGYGRRKTWHAIGTVSVIVSFPFLFLRPLLLPDDALETALMVYYACFIAVFQFGWASTQVSHLALIPQLTTVDREKVQLNAFRNAFTVLSSVTVYGSAWFLLSADSSAQEENQPETLSIQTLQFKELMVICVVTGALFSLIFHFGTPESNSDNFSSDFGTSNSSMLAIGLLDWFREYQFYLIALMYMCSRLIVNVSQTYWPLYLMDSLHLTKNFIAIVPLVIFSSGFVMSLLMTLMTANARQKAICFVGLLLTIVSCAAMWLLTKDNAIFVLIPAVLLGTGGCILLITSLSMTADLIGKHTESSAFVFGTMSFVDKLSSGTCIALIQVFHPCKSSKCCPDCEWYYRSVMVLLPTGVAAVSLCILLALLPIKIGRLRWTPR